MANVTFVGGPLAGQVQDVAAASVNVLDDSRLGRVVLVTYRVDASEARVVSEVEC